VRATISANEAAGSGRLSNSGSDLDRARRADVTTILGPLRANSEKHPDKLLFAFLDVDGRTKESYTYERFLQRVSDVASHVHANVRVERGERVLLVYPPGLEMICAFYACVQLGLIPVPVYPPSSHGFTAALMRMNAIAKDCGATAVLTDRSYYWSMKLHRARTLAALSLPRDYTAKLKWIATSDAERCGGVSPPDAHSEILFLQYTSGSTSEPKGVMVTHHNVLANCQGVVDHPAVAVSWLPQYHDMGLIAFYMFSPICGGTTYGSSPLDFVQRPLLWLEAMSRFRATASAAPNFAYEYCLRPDKVHDESLAGLDLSSLRILLSGAEPVKAGVFRCFLERFRRCGLEQASFSTAYGLAEHTLAVCLRGRETRSFDALALQSGRALTARRPIQPRSEKSLVSSGVPVGGTAVEIVDTSGIARALPDGRVGEVWVSGPSKCAGYWGRPELTRETFEAKLENDPLPDRAWLRTGDLGFVHHGEVYVCGRSKDLIIVRGANYYPQDIEAVVEEDAAVRRGCTAAFDADGNGQDNVIVVAELRNRSRLPDAQRIHRNIRDRLGLTVDAIAFIPRRTIPKTSSGKISRHRARARWLEGGFDVVRSVPAYGHANGAEAQPDLAGPRGALERLFRRHGLTGDEQETLLEAGLDSLGLVDFARDLEEHLEARGAADLGAGVQVRWLQKLPVCELFELVCQLDGAVPSTKLRFRRVFAALEREHLDAEHDLMRRDARQTPDMPSSRAERVATPGSLGGPIFLTAGTGFFGPFLLRSLLEQCDQPVHVLVRARDAEHARRRLEEGLASLGAPPIEGWGRRLIPICGDLSRPRLGLSPGKWDTLCDDVHTVYHNGALVNYLLDYGSMRDANVEATREIVRLASTGRSKILNHVSSTFVFGWSTKEILFESDTNAGMESLDFGYSQSKWVSEQIVLRAFEAGLRGRVFRPALIAPSVSGGGYNFDIAIRMLAFMLNHGISTTAQNEVSLAPADVAAHNIVAISRLSDTIGQTFHVTRDDYATLLDVSALLGEQTGTRFVDYPVKEFVATMIARCRRGDLLFPLVDFLVHSADNITAMEFKRYDNSNYRRARDRAPGAVPDPPLSEVVAGILRFMAKHGILRPREAEPVLEGVS
jgi:thioester reductase-like protein